MKVLHNFLQILPKKGLKSMLFRRDTQSSNYKYTYFLALGELEIWYIIQ